MSNELKSEQETPGQDQNNNSNLHPLYIEQQQWFQQFKNNEQLTNPCMNNLQFQQQGYRRHKHHHWKQCQGNQGQVENQQEQTKYNDVDIIQIIGNTNIIYVDCNNIKYSCGKWDKFRGRPKKQIQKILKIISLWLKNQVQILDEVHLIWDVYKMSKIDRLKEKINKYEMFKQLLEVRQEQKITTFKIQYNEKLIKFSIQSAHPDIADDLIVNLCTNQNNEQTTIVTSDKGLRERLQQAGVTQFIGNGKWWRLKEELKQNDK